MLSLDLSMQMSTLTVYPVAGANSPCDGFIYKGSGNWATVIAGNGSAVSVTDQSDFLVGYFNTATTDTIARLYRSIFNFDTSALTAGATISGAVMSIRGDDKYDDATATTPNVNVYLATPAATNTLAVGDYAQIGSTPQTGSPITYANWSTVGYNDFTFNATGVGNVSKTGISSFGLRNANYDVAATPPTWSSSTYHALFGRYADYTGTDNDPKLVVTYTTVVPDTSSFFNFI